MSEEGQSASMRLVRLLNGGHLLGKEGGGRTKTGGGEEWNVQGGPFLILP
jgi:hypothetical protein